VADGGVAVYREGSETWRVVGLAADIGRGDSGEEHGMLATAHQQWCGIERRWDQAKSGVTGGGVGKTTALARQSGVDGAAACLKINIVA
jgi:hypothetical protein